jgi:hypothetical protein
MLFKHKHLLEELRETGRQATAEIINITTLGEGTTMRAMWAPDSDLSTGWMDCRMQLRVMPKGHAEPPFEATVMTRIHTLKFQGGSVPVWYDPNDRSRVVVDYEADLAANQQNMADLERLTHRHDQRLGLAWTPLGGTLIPIEITVKPGKGRLSLKGQLEKLLAATAPAAIGYVTSHAATFAPELAGDWFAHNDLHVDEPYGSVAGGVTAQDAASTGLAIAAALASLIGGHLVRTEVALAGGLTQAGELIAVDNLKDKAHAAKQGYSTRLVVPASTARLPESQHRGLEIVYAATPEEALHAALTKRAAGRH